MQIRIIICCALFLAAASQANAEKLQVNMTPAALGDGFAIEMTSLENGKTRFTITRDPSKANQPTDPELTLVRGATLSVYNQAGLVAQCPVAPRRNKSGKLVYEFQLDNGHVKRSRFVLSEGVDYKQGDLALVNGTCYSFSLIDFVDPNDKVKKLRELGALPKVDPSDHVKELREHGALPTVDPSHHERDLKELGALPKVDPSDHEKELRELGALPKVDPKHHEEELREFGALPKN